MSFVLDILMDAISQSEDAALIVTADGSVVGTNAAAVRRGVVESVDVAHVEHVLMGGDAVWAAMADAASDKLVVVPTVTAVLCAWRVTERVADDGSPLFLLTAECTGVGAQAYADAVNHKAPKKTKHKALVPNNASDSESSSNDTDSVTGGSSELAFEDVLRANHSSRSTCSSMSRSSSSKSLKAISRTTSNTNTSKGQGQGLRAAIVPVQSPSQSPADAEPSPGKPTSSSDLSRDASLALQLTRQRSWLDRIRRSPKASSSFTIDLSRDPIEVLQVLYAGPMATVTRASVGGLEVAIKSVPTRYISASERAELAAVIGLSATLQHPNLLRQLGYNLESTAEFMIFFELCEATLSELWKSADAAKHTAPTALAKQAHQVACALQYIHGKSIMHRDIKASNVLVRFVVRDVLVGTRETVMKLSDFGEMAMVVPNTAYRTNVGTPEFMAPEVVAVDSSATTRQYDHQCDMWSFGMFLFEALKGGQVPYADVDRWELNSTIASGTRPALAGASSDNIKRALHQMFLDCTIFKAAERSTATSIVVRLEQLLGS
jgi:hypothetical protein